MKKCLPLVTILSVLLLASCSATRTPEQTAAREARIEAKKERAAANAPTPAPAGSPLAKITNGMSDSDVTRILGQPTSSKDYATGKQWIPGYMGPDTSRTEYIYKGVGRITLSRNRYSGGLKVIRVDYDPSL